MAKRSASSRRDASSGDTSEVPFSLDPSLAIGEEDESESEESYYSGLESEVDTSDDEELVLSDEEGSEFDGLGSNEEGVRSAEQGPSEESGREEEEEGEDEGEGKLEEKEVEEEEEGELEEEREEGEGEGKDEEEEEGRDVDLFTESWKEAEDTDTSDEEEVRNTVGNIPLEWYENYPHVGYNQDGKKVFRPASGDELDEFLAKMEDPNYWRTVRDKWTGKETVLTDRELDMVQRMQQSRYPLPSFDPYEPYIDFFTHEKMDHPLSSAPPPKSSFIPSKWERQKISKLVHAIKMGWLKPQKKPERPKFYSLWSDTDSPEQRKHHLHIPAPRVQLPGHSESYNPPPEYLPTPDETKEWEEMDPEDRPTNFLPHKYDSLRQVPGYSRFIEEQFARCLDLYLCPRQRKMRVKVDPEDLIPKLPKPRDLQPFPTREAVVYEGHAGPVRCLSVEPLGQWLASGSDDETLRLWEVATGRCMQCLSLSGKPSSVSFCPSPHLSLLAIAVANTVLLVNHQLGDRLVVMATDSALSSANPPEGVSTAAQSTPSPVVWQLPSDSERKKGVKMALFHNKPVRQVVWHSKGDYFATVISDASDSAVYIHQLCKRRSQNPFKKLRGAVQKVSFHPLKPLFFVATQTYVRVYNLVKQELTKKLVSGVKWISSMAIHPHGDNVIIGSYDKRLSWFDLDLSVRPYRVIRHHKQAIRQVCFHSRYPLFASCSDDASVIICHGMVYNDLMQNPHIVPVKVLKGHTTTNSLGVVDCQFHPSQPWIFTAGADATLRLYS